MQPDWLSSMEPGDDLAWQAVADWLEEQGQPLRGELLRLTRVLCRDLSCPDRKKHEDRQIELLAQGVEPFTLGFSNSIGMGFVWVPAGRFLMGASMQKEEYSSPDEGPVHEVAITRGFWMGKYPVTQREYSALMARTPSRFRAGGKREARVQGMDTSRFPVENVSWERAERFCRKLSRRQAESQALRRYGLPTEAQWEHACRGGILAYPFHFGPNLSSREANFDGTYPYGCVNRGPFLRRPCPVGSYRPNGFGLHDMHGNVFEWCADWFDGDYYANSPREDPTGPDDGVFRSLRGGSWFVEGGYCRSGFRCNGTETDRRHDFGFRVVCLQGTQGSEDFTPG